MRETDIYTYTHREGDGYSHTERDIPEMQESSNRVKQNKNLIFIMVSQKVD